MSSLASVVRKQPLSAKQPSLLARTLCSPYFELGRVAAPGFCCRVSVSASSTAGSALRRCGATMSSALGEAARNSSGLCAAATSAPLAATAASASSAAHLSSSSLHELKSVLGIQSV